MMRAVIICAGTVSDYEYARSLISAEDFVICADGGLNHAQRMGIEPKLVIGDFDSYKGAPPSSDVITLPCEKDYTDSYNALYQAKLHGAGEVLFIGASGSRLDHTIVNIALLKAAREMGIEAVMADKTNRLYLAKNREVITGEKGTTVSLIPLSPVSSITLRGFKYPLNNADIQLFNPIWVSNELAEERAEIEFREGTLLIDIVNE